MKESTIVVGKCGIGILGTKCATTTRDSIALTVLFNLDHFTYFGRNHFLFART
jgi:hypothetical protein